MSFWTTIQESISQLPEGYTIMLDIKKGTVGIELYDFEGQEMDIPMKQLSPSGKVGLCDKPCGHFICIQNRIAEALAEAKNDNRIYDEMKTLTPWRE